MDSFVEEEEVFAEEDETVHPESLEETPPLFLMKLYYLVSSLVVNYGWYILVLVIATVYYWEKIQKYLDERYRNRSEKEYEAMCKKNPDLMRKRQEEMEAARRRMQEEMNRKAILHAEKMKEKEEQRRAELLASHPEGGQKLGDKVTSPTAAAAGQTTGASSASKKNFRSEYNPLMGAGSSGGYRPPRRGCPGGGCG